MLKLYNTIFHNYGKALCNGSVCFVLRQRAAFFSIPDEYNSVQFSHCFSKVFQLNAHNNIMNCDII